MIIEHIKASDLKPNQWPGGTTTQLAIYPNDADYKKLNFQFRISTATVESEESSFTKLPGVSRKLMILDGEIKIEHKSHYTKILKKFEQDSFEGDWDTKSYGKATDFNLMTTGSTTGEIDVITVKNKKGKTIKLSSDYIGIYILKGQVDLFLNNKTIKLLKGDFVDILAHNSETMIQIKAKELSELIFTRLNL